VNLLELLQVTPIYVADLGVLARRIDLLSSPDQAECSTPESQLAVERRTWITESTLPEASELASASQGVDASVWARCRSASA